MRDFLAVLIVLLLLVVAMSLVAGLKTHHRRREETLSAVRKRGRTIVVEVPAERELKVFSKDYNHFYYGEHVIPKNQIQAVRVLINGSPIAAYASRRFPSAVVLPPTSFNDKDKGIVKDQWDVEIKTTKGTTLVECGAIRERVSQELARKIFEEVKTDVDAL